MWTMLESVIKGKFLLLSDKPPFYYTNSDGGAPYLSFGEAQILCDQLNIRDYGRCDAETQTGDNAG